MPTIHLTTGLPASGKTTRARELMAAANGGMRRINLDDIRAMLDDNGTGAKVWSHKHEATVQAIQESAIRAAVAGGWDVVVDNTHLTQRMPGRIKQIVAGRADFEVHDFTGVPLEECLRRDAARPRPVGEDAIRRLHQRHASAIKGGWRLTAEWMNDNPLALLHPYVPDASLPMAIGCDLDGTAALHVARGPYQYELCETDAPNPAVIEALAMYRDCGYRVVLLSGRPEADDAGRDIRAMTIRWLRSHGIEFDELHMRPAGDKRGDDIVKAELFDRNVRNRFNVRLMLDDRDRLITLWRRMNLPTWQVNYGNF